MFKTYLLILLIGAVFAQDVLLDDNEDQFEASASEQDLAVAESAVGGDKNFKNKIILFGLNINLNYFFVLIR